MPSHFTPYGSPHTPDTVVKATALDLLKCCKEKVLPACASGSVATVAQDFLSMAVYLGIATLIL
jgi:hypothetical protein